MPGMSHVCPSQVSTAACGSSGQEIESPISIMKSEIRVFATPVSRLRESTEFMSLGK